MSHLPEFFVKNTEKWVRVLQEVNGSYYINIPKSLIDGFGMKKGYETNIYKAIDEKTKKIILVLDIDGDT